MHWSTEAMTPTSLIIAIFTWYHRLMHQLVLLRLSVVLNILVDFSMLHHLQVPVNWAIWVGFSHSCHACPFGHLHFVIWSWRQWWPSSILILDIKQLNNSLLIINYFSCFRTIIPFPWSWPDVASVFLVFLLRWKNIFFSILGMILWGLHISLV